ncbi:FRG domain-containing protein [Vibrio vulnificus]|nr:FRG domain-containing protein [Vibrio vulnificus]EKZ9057810.1 FRG domain-containing protein [Vibrio vulnificus]ELV8706781.1 FRG domain-containing protein [Vibrio vulnificus]ELV8809019.1 FRG domain-containing protein [Vibrio vulnificus]MCU8395936.1 FRG domain-containing protein [Vibrio vulnificus]
MSEIKEAKLGSVRTLLRILPDFEDKSSVFLFRGHANKEFDLLPSIYRRPQWFSNEDKIIREIIMRCPAEFGSMTSSFEKLVKMQHYDLPTRLLDVTENPLVALYFACVGEKHAGEDGEIIFFKVPRSEVKYFDSDTVTVVSNVAWAKPDFEIADRFSRDHLAFHKEDNHHASKLMHDIKQEKPHFLERINPDHIKSVICVKPKMDNPRVVRQDGAFLLFGIGQNKYEPASVDNEWIFRPESKRYIIKSSDKPMILKQLSTLGISKAKLFPEIDMVSQFIKDDYDLNSIDFKSSISGKNIFVRPKTSYGW